MSLRQNGIKQQPSQRPNKQQPPQTNHVAKPLSCSHFVIPYKNVTLHVGMCINVDRNVDKPVVDSMGIEP